MFGLISRTYTKLVSYPGADAWLTYRLLRANPVALVQACDYPHKVSPGGYCLFGHTYTLFTLRKPRSSFGLHNRGFLLLYHGWYQTIMGIDNPHVIPSHRFGAIHRYISPAARNFNWFVFVFGNSADVLHQQDHVSVVAHSNCDHKQVISEQESKTGCMVV